MHKQILLLAAILLVFVVESPVMAEIQGREISVSTFLGGYTFDGKQHVQTNIAVGLGLGYNLTKHWGLEGNFTLVPVKYTINNRKGDLFNLRGDVLYHFMPERKLVPFVALGGGWSETPKPFNNNTNQDLTLDYGGGVKYFFNDWLALRGDARHIFSFHSKEPTWQNFEYTIGVTFQSRRPKSVSPAVKEVVPAAAVQPAEPEPKTVKEEPVQVEPMILKAENTVAPEGKSLITEMRVENNEIEIIANVPIRDYKLFTLTEPSRLVIDISKGASGFTLEKIAINKLGVATVRFESYPDYLRIFFDSVQGKMLPYRVEETAKGLKIIITGP